MTAQLSTTFSVCWLVMLDPWDCMFTENEACLTLKKSFPFLFYVSLSCCFCVAAAEGLIGYHSAKRQPEVEAG